MPRFGSRQPKQKPRATSLLLGPRSAGYGASTGPRLPTAPQKRRAVSWDLTVSSTPLHERYRKYHTQQGAAGNFGFAVTVCFIVNLVVGSGFLGLPKAFADAGILLGLTVTLVAAYFADLTKNYVLETMARAEAVTEYTLFSGSLVTRRTSRAGDSGMMDAVRNMPNYWEPEYTITDRKFEITELCELFLGKWPKYLYIAALALFTYGAQWAYASVFATSLAANIPLWFLNDGEVCDPDIDPERCWANFHVYLALFSVIVIAWTCADLREQRAVQVFMSAARFAIILMMVLTILVAPTCDGVVFAGRVKPAHTGVAIPAGLKTLIPVMVYALIVHMTIPTVSQPSSARGKKLVHVFSAAYVGIVTCYVATGLIIGTYFGQEVDAQCNLMWATYVGCVDPAQHGGSVTVSDAPFWAKVIREVVLLFPALDVASATPLQAITLGGNFLSAWAGSLSPKLEKAKVVKLAFRMLAVIPPLLGAFVVSNLDRIMAMAGLIGFAIAFFVPAALSIAARKRCYILFGPEFLKTPYAGKLNFPYSEIVVLVLFGAAAAYVTVTTILSF